MDNIKLSYLDSELIEAPVEALLKMEFFREWIERGINRDNIEYCVIWRVNWKKHQSIHNWKLGYLVCELIEASIASLLKIGLFRACIDRGINRDTIENWVIERLNW